MIIENNSLAGMTYLPASKTPSIHPFIHPPPTRAASGTGQARHRKIRESVQKKEVLVAFVDPASHDWVMYGYKQGQPPPDVTY
ncbi:uncharacterized protein CCOS01_06706 [Colletotrichum costaricense]|uniref:Uncharacterized protein n=1 Tax=Colletotrichum costaricense TaxID=1209916 RepID=A0AAI9YYN2_9PEZI|nr:uncharacterized protein CCOS01_06706 [Colletotrichum costaricense]KAK1528872.1 hypothetical protein CCOS01_06706 [Colletotrichum costaricense]